MVDLSIEFLTRMPLRYTRMSEFYEFFNIFAFILFPLPSLPPKGEGTCLTETHSPPSGEMSEG